MLTYLYKDVYMKSRTDWSTDVTYQVTDSSGLVGSNTCVFTAFHVFSPLPTSSRSINTSAFCSVFSAQEVKQAWLQIMAIMKDSRRDMKLVLGAIKYNLGCVAKP